MGYRRHQAQQLIEQGFYDQRFAMPPYLPSGEGNNPQQAWPTDGLNLIPTITNLGQLQKQLNDWLTAIQQTLHVLEDRA